MVEIRVGRRTTVSAEAVIAAAKDFSERRPDFWPGLDPSRYHVHEVSATSADVTEGSAVMGGIWARERYDLSKTQVVRAEVQESNVFAPGSSWELHARPDEHGDTDVQWVSRRIGKGLKGRIFVVMLRLFGEKQIGKMLDETLRRLAERDTMGASRGGL